MNYPKPISSINSAQGVTDAGAWHNYLLDNSIAEVIASGKSAANPIQARRFADGMLTNGAINSVEHSYVFRYVDLYESYYAENTNTWQRGHTYLPATLWDDIKNIHDTAAADPNVIGDIFRSVSNIVLGSAEYWHTGGAWVPTDPASISI